MAIIYSDAHSWIISHDLFIERVYKCTYTEDDAINRYKLKDMLFEIKEPYENLGIEVKDYLTPTDEEKDIYVDWVNDAIMVKRTHMCLLNRLITPKNDIKCEIPTEEVVNDLIGSHIEKKLCGGSYNTCRLREIGMDEYIIPNNCRFYNHDIKEMKTRLKGLIYDFILMDPPWWDDIDEYSANISPNLIQIPVSTLLAPDGLVAVWCTNSSTHHEALVKHIFPAWGVSYISQWFWLKVTKAGEPVCPFSKPPRMQPFERILFARKSCAQFSPEPQNNKVIVSVPSIIESHKPPLGEVLQGYLPPNPRRLEVFARYLLPHWTSYGNEVLKLQRFGLYQTVDLSHQQKRN